MKKTTHNQILGKLRQDRIKALGNGGALKTQVIPDKRQELKDEAERNDGEEAQG